MHVQMSYRCYGDGLVKPLAEIVLTCDVTDPADEVCIYRGVCAICVTLPLANWVMTPPQDMITYDVRPRSVITP